MQIPTKEQNYHERITFDSIEGKQAKFKENQYRSWSDQSSSSKDGIQIEIACSIQYPIPLTWFISNVMIEM